MAQEVAIAEPGILPIGNYLHFRWDEVRENAFDEWVFPGNGRPYGDCGTYFTKGCLDHIPAFVKKIRVSCRRSECPLCAMPPRSNDGKSYKTWIVEATRRIKHRIKAGRPRSGRRRRPIHISINPAPDLWPKFIGKDGYGKMRRKAGRVAKKAGFNGGCLIFHPYREKKPDKLWYWSPHFHAIGYGWIVNTAEISRDTGFVVKNHRVRESIGATAYYQLSHAGVKYGHRVISWIGDLAWNSEVGKRIPKMKAELELCPICEGMLYPVEWKGGGDNPLSDHGACELQLPDPTGWVYVGTNVGYLGEVIE
jgi:hypothetical protein